MVFLKQINFISCYLISLFLFSKHNASFQSFPFAEIERFILTPPDKRALISTASLWPEASLSVPISMNKILPLRLNIALIRSRWYWGTPIEKAELILKAREHRFKVRSNVTRDLNYLSTS